MAQFFGGASKYLIQQKKLNKFWAFFGAVLVILSLILLWLLVYSFSYSFILSITAEIVIFLFFLLISRTVNEYIRIALRYKKGIRGEDQLANEFHNLPNGYTVFQDVKLPNTQRNIDFVVVGPTGIYAIEVKNVNGIISFDGQNLFCNKQLLERKNVIQQVRDEYWGLHDYLVKNLGSDIFVTPLLVFTNQSVFENIKSGKMISGIHILHLHDIFRFITSQYHQSRFVTDEKIIKIIQKITEKNLTIFTRN
jgi:hypothetical protein